MLLFHNEIIPYGLDPFDAAGDLACLIGGLLRINETAQLNDAFTGFYADLKGLEKIIRGKLGFYLGCDDRIIDIFPRT